MQQSPLHPILPLHHVSEPYAEKGLVAQRPKCANFQAFLNTFSLYKLIFFSFFVRGSSVNSQKFHILLILSGTYLGFKVCQIQWHLS